MQFSDEDEVMIVVKKEEEAIEIATDNWGIDHELDEVYFDVI